jgi:hypothetical protein
MRRFLIVAIAAIIALSACGASGAAPRGVPTRVFEAGPAQSDRVAAVEKFFVKPPTPIRDGRLLQVQLGDGELGPSDFHVFVMASIDPTPSNLAAWRGVFNAPLDPRPGYVSPNPTPAWWLAESAHAARVFYDAGAFSQNDGWISIGDDGVVYAFTTTR